MEGWFNRLHKGAQVNCTLIAEKCVRVLAGLDTPSLVLPKREDLGITFRENENGTVIYHEVTRKEQAQLATPQQFIETIDIVEAAKAQVDLTQTLERTSLKYITSTLAGIAEDIQAITGSAASEGKDKTLCGLIYYYYKNLNAGHLANFYRDKHGNIFFVDAQSESITEAPPTRILGYELRDEVFFYPLIPRDGFFIKKEPGLLREQSDTMDEDTYVAGITKAALAKSATKFHLKGEQIQEQTDSMLDILDQELFQEINIDTIDQEKSEESSTEEDATSTESSDNTSPRQIIGHKRKRNQKETYTCGVCNKGFTIANDLKRHKRIHTGEKPYQCNQCDKAFADSSTLTKHKRTHTKEKPFQCDRCDYSTAYSTALKCHKRTHTGEKPYTCNQCTKTFSSSSGLTEHKRIHTGEKPYKCNLCEKSFTQSGVLKRHKHAHAEAKCFKCDLCGYATATSSDLSKHKHTHTGEKPYECDQCDKAFADSSTLRTHKRIHTGEKPYKCDVCDKTFTQSSNLSSHKRTHTGEKPYECDQCEKAFADSSHLKRHKNTHNF